MESLQFFAPKLSGPASHGNPFCAVREEDEAEVREEDEAEDIGADAEEDSELASGRCRAPDALIAEENANAEFLIGLDGSPDDDAVGKLAAFRAKLNMAAEFQKRLSTVEQRIHQSRTSDNDQAWPWKQGRLVLHSSQTTRPSS